MMSTKVIAGTDCDVPHTTQSYEHSTNAPHVIHAIEVVTTFCTILTKLGSNLDCGISPALASKVPIPSGMPSDPTSLSDFILGAHKPQSGLVPHTSVAGEWAGLNIDPPPMELTRIGKIREKITIYCSRVKGALGDALRSLKEHLWWGAKDLVIDMVKRAWAANPLVSFILIGTTLVSVVGALFQFGVAMTQKTVEYFKNKTPKPIQVLKNMPHTTTLDEYMKPAYRDWETDRKSVV